jgi:pyruvate dehydrogenase E1 component beta subunit
MRVRQAIVSALAEEMRSDETVIFFGEDVAAAEGPFKTSEGILDEFGPIRVRDTPISEMGFTGAAVGAAMMGLKPVVEIMFIEFLGVALDALVTEGAKMHYLSNGELSVPMTIRASAGSGLGFGSQHSQTLENWLAATPGLKVVMPSDAQSAYSLLRAAIQDPNPVVVLEPRALYAERGEVDKNIISEIGKAQIRQKGTELTIVASGQMVGIAESAIKESGASVELIDLQTVVPWDRETIRGSVAKTGRLIVVEESPSSGGWGSEIIADIVRNHFSALKSTPFRMTTPDVPVPYSGDLEARFIPQAADIVSKIQYTLKRSDAPAPWWVEEGVSK